MALSTDTIVITAYVMPVDVGTMNWNAVILVGVITLTAVWWFVHASRHYPGPKVMTMYIHDDHHRIVDSVPITAKEAEKREKAGVPL